MKLTWADGSGPGTTQALADEIEREGKLYAGSYVTRDDRRCLWGVINDWRMWDGNYARPDRHLSTESAAAFHQLGLTTAENDNRFGSPEARCKWAVEILRQVP